MEAKRARVISDKANYKLRKHAEALAKPIIKDVVQTVKIMAILGNYECDYVVKDIFPEVRTCLEIKLSELGYVVGINGDTWRIKW